jgi:hypothetical protein
MFELGITFGNNVYSLLEIHCNFEIAANSLLLLDDLKLSVELNIEMVGYGKAV